MASARTNLAAFYPPPQPPAGLPNRLQLTHYYAMADLAPRRISPLNIVLDGVLLLAAFFLFFRLAAPHVPSEDPVLIALWSGYAAACMTGVFWIAWQMLKAVFRHQRETARDEP